MIDLKINGQIKSIPKSDELTTAQYIELLKIKEFTIIDYLAVVLGVKMKVAEDFKIKNPAFLAAQLYGNFTDYSKSKPKKSLTIDGRRYNLDPDCTLGQRFIIEENGKNLKDYDLLIFILAVFCDTDNYESLQEKILNEPASKIMPEAFFLLKNLQSGSRLGRIFSRVFKYLMMTQSLRNRRALKALAKNRIIMR